VRNSAAEEETTEFRSGATDAGLNISKSNFRAAREIVKRAGGPVGRFKVASKNKDVDEQGKPDAFSAPGQNSIRSKSPIKGLDIVSGSIWHTGTFHDSARRLRRHDVT